MFLIKLFARATGIESAEAKIDSWAAGARDLSPAYRQFAKDLAAFLGGVITSEGVLDGGTKWAPLNPEYKAQKIAEGGAPNILVKTGQLLSDATNPRKLLRRASHHRATYAIVTPYYKYLHHGTRHMPARVLLRKGPILEAALHKRCVDHITNSRARERAYRARRKAT